MENETEQTLSVARPISPAPVAIPPSPASPQECRVMEVSEALAPAYMKASTLEITDDEMKALTALFPDDAVEIRPHDGLIYIPHIFISDRLNEVFKPGKWVLMRRREWFDQSTQVIYGEYVLLIRGCFVGESVGGHPFITNNPKTNYSDALESTAAEALRRIAGKRLSCGGQVWKPEYSRQWVAKFAEQKNGKWHRRAISGPGGSQDTNQRPNAAPAPQPASRPAARTEQVVPPSAPQVEADKDQRFRFLAALSAIRTEATTYFIQKGWLTQGQELEALSNKYVPTVKKQYDSIMAELKAFMDGDGQTDELWWKKVCVPFGAQQGTPIGELDKKKLYGWCANYEVEEEYNGVRKPDSEIEVMRRFSEALDAAADHYEF